MLTIRLSPKAAPNLNNQFERHLYEALSRTDRARVVFDGDADFGWNVLGRRSTRSIWYCCADPWALGREYDVAKLLVSWQLDVLPLIGETRGRFRNFREKMSEAEPVSDIANREGWDIFATRWRDPMKEIVVPRLRGKFFRIPPSVPEWIFHSTGEETRCLDAFFLGVTNFFYPLRTLMVETLERAAKEHLQVAIVRAHRYDGRRTSEEQDEHQRWYATNLRHAKIACFDGGVCNVAVQKYFEAMACGALALAPLPRDAEILGFRDGETMVAVTPENWREKFAYYLKNDRERVAITSRARKLVQDHFTCAAQVAHVVRRLERVVDGDDLDRVDADYDEELRKWAPGATV